MEVNSLAKLSISVKKKIKPFAPCDPLCNPCYSMLKARHCRDDNHRPIHIFIQKPSEGEQLHYIIFQKLFPIMLYSRKILY